MTNFTYFYKTKYSDFVDIAGHKKYDLFISAYNDSERVIKVFDVIDSTQKHWLFFPEYNIAETFVNNGDLKISFQLGEEEGEAINKYLDQSGITPNLSICIDITGFLIPHLLYLVNSLYKRKIKKIDIIYSEPNTYKLKEQTVFSSDFNSVRQVQGYEGAHNPDTSNDILIIASGYDDSRITDVANSKAKTRKIQLFGFPSLQPDMYQENILKAYKAEAAVGGRSFIDTSSNIYASANDPFIAAQMIKKFILKEEKIRPLTNIYLSPISTKTHALGMAIYYIWELGTRPISIIYPFCESHIGNTTEGISKVSIFTVEFPN